MHLVRRISFAQRNIEIHSHHQQGYIPPRQGTIQSCQGNSSTATAQRTIFPTPEHVPLQLLLSRSAASSGRPLPPQVRPVRPKIGPHNSNGTYKAFLCLLAGGSVRFHFPPPLYVRRRAAPCRYWNHWPGGPESRAWWARTAGPRTS
jgi:hypothetical protein